MIHPAVNMGQTDDSLFDLDDAVVHCESDQYELGHGLAVLTYCSVLPAAARIVEVPPFRISAWSQPSRISTICADGEARDYFLKTSATDAAMVMCRGEYHSLEALCKLLPDSCPKPVGWGEFKAAQGTFFVIMEFLPLVSKHPDPAKLTHSSDLHMKSQEQSPDGKFGFHVPSCHGKVICPNAWDDNWARYFTNFTRIFFDLDIETNGTYPGYEGAFLTLTDKVIPRLLEHSNQMDVRWFRVWSMAIFGMRTSL